MSRFVLLNLDLESGEIPKAPPSDKLRDEDRWILSRLQKTVQAVNKGFEGYDMDDAARALYDFLWNEYADWYIEIAKPRLQTDEKPVVRYVLWHVLETSMRLLHPIMPSITEQIWQSIPHEGESIMVAPFPEMDVALSDEDAERRMEAVMEVTRAIRNLRAELGVAPGKQVESVIVPASAKLRATIESGAASIKSLAKVGKLDIASESPATEHARFISAHLPMADVYIPLAGLVDVDKETARIKGDLAGVEKELARSAGKLSNEQFMSRAPAHVIEKEQRIAQELTEKRAKLQERLSMLK